MKLCKDLGDKRGNWGKEISKLFLMMFERLTKYGIMSLLFHILQDYYKIKIFGILF